jgi:hypothetical protein
MVKSGPAVTENAVVPAGRWVRVHRIELAPAERAPGLPEDTAAVPFESWINGWLLDETEVGGRAQIRTLAGRLMEGELIGADPGYAHSFGAPPSALQHASERARRRLFDEASP